MNILYGIQGTGNGHIAKAPTILSILKSLKMPKISMLTSIFAESRRRHCAAEKGTKLACFRPQFFTRSPKIESLEFSTETVLNVAKKSKLIRLKLKKMLFYCIVLLAFH